MPITSKERAALRGRANGLPAKVHIGREGLTDAVVRTIDDTLRTQELVKVALTKQATHEPKPLAQDLAEGLGADVVQVIGRTIVLWRPRPPEA